MQAREVRTIKVRFHYVDTETATFKDGDKSRLEIPFGDWKRLGKPTELRVDLEAA